MPRWWNGRHATLRSLWAKARESSNLFLGTKPVNKYLMQLLIGILTSEKIDKLERCIKSVLTQVDPANVVIVINSLDEKYQNLAVHLSAKYGLKSVVTESNGRPGKGKNSLLAHFMNSAFTHIVPVDGDDILLPNAIEKLTAIINDKNPDILGLIDGLVLLNDEIIPVEDWQKHEIYFKRGFDNIDPKNYKKFNLHIAKIRRTSIEYGNMFNRFVVISRKAASYINYDEELAGAEDIKQGLLLKLIHLEGKINYMLLSNQDIYLYDVTDEGVFFNTLCKSDPSTELKRFWHDLSNEQISTLQTFQLECIYD